MSRDSRYDILFEPVKIGPVTSPNRFYQVPHCTGFGYSFPNMLAGHREVKAEGMWGVVCTEMCEIHPSSDVMPYIETRLWDDSDIAHHAKIAEVVHRHGSLAGIELAHGGIVSQNMMSRVPPMGPGSHRNPEPHVPVQSKTMTKKDIRDVLRWQKEAALRAKQADFDIVYVYASHNMGLPIQFLTRRYNDRSDEYGGSLENRARLLREMIETTKDAVGDRCGVVVRFGVESFIGEDGMTLTEAKEVIEMLGEYPDLWDVNVNDWPMDSSTSRFEEEGFQEPYIDFVKSVTTKPVVGVGRFTSPDAMVSQIKRGVLDMIGAARPSIADPWLPRKIDENRLEEIRECIGCNICVSGDVYHVPMRCTQNPTVGEEWRRGWHPEKFEDSKSDDDILIIGSGPAGLEAALILARRGYSVTIAEAREELGGRITQESALPGLSAWIRVMDYRLHQLQQMVNVQIYPASPLSADDVLEFGIARVICATGAKWRSDGLGAWNPRSISGLENMNVYSPEEVFEKQEIEGPVVVYDDDHFYLGGLIAEQMKLDGIDDVTLVTPYSMVAAFAWNTLEQPRIQAHLIESGIKIVTSQNCARVEQGKIHLECAYTGRQEMTLDAKSLISLSARIPQNQIYQELMSDATRLELAGIKSVDQIGDCVAPSTIAAAVHSGTMIGRNFDSEDVEPAHFLREHVAIEN